MVICSLKWWFVPSIKIPLNKKNTHQKTKNHPRHLGLLGYLDSNTIILQHGLTNWSTSCTLSRCGDVALRIIEGDFSWRRKCRYPYKRWEMLNRFYMGVEPKIGGKHPKMDGLKWKSLFKWMIWGENPLFSETSIYTPKNSTLNPKKKNGGLGAVFQVPC